MRTYTYRRELERSDRIKALGLGAGAGLGVGLVVTYLAGVFLQRTPLSEPVVPAPEPNVPRRPRP